MQIDLGIPGARLRTEADMAKVDRLDNMLGQKDQLMAEVRRHLRLNPKPHTDRVTVPDISNRMNHTRTKQRKPTVHSFVAGRNVHRWQSPLDQVEPNPFSAMHQEVDILANKRFQSTIQLPSTDDPCIVKKFCNNPCKCLKNISEHPPPQARPRATFSPQNEGKDTLNGCKVNKQLERLQVPSYPLPPSVLDYQTNFFTSVKSRPLQERFKRSESIKMQRSVFFNTLMTGHIKDDVRRRQEQHKLDMWQLQEISHELDVVKKTFKKFIESSNEDSVALVKDQLHAGHQRDEVEAKLETHKGKLNMIKTVIFRLEGQISTLLLCRDLMLKLSPSAWRKNYEHQAKGYDVKQRWLNDLFNFYSDYCRYYPGPKDFFLDEAMELLFNAVETMGPPQIYFTESWQIAMLMRRQELDCLRQVGDVVDLERKIAEIYKLSKDSTKYRTAEMNIISEMMNKGQAEFDYQKKRATELEEMALEMIPKYVDTLFSGDVMLETTALIEALYSDIFGQGHQMPDSLQMMIEIERVIRLQNEELVEMDPKVVKYFKKKVEDEARKRDKAAARAKRVYREAKSFVNAARAMYEPPPRVPRTWKIPLRRSKVPLRRKKTKTLCKRENHFQYLQLNGIVIKDDVEVSLDRAIAAFVGLPVRMSGPDEGIEDQTEHDSLSYASTESLEKAVYDQPDSSIPSRNASDVDQKDELIVIEMGYDSDEELIKQNYDKKKGLAEKPPVLYDAKMLDDRFMVESDVKPAEKNRRRVSREPPQTYKNNALSWR